MLHGQVNFYCEQVNAGAKLCAQLIFKNEYSLIIRNTVKKEKSKAC